ncbi:hypothetical protein RhiirB3_412607, partial [Rhizophagus irregularis]
MPHYPVFEWIPYNEFINVKEIGNDCLTIAISKKEGPCYYDTGEARISYQIVCL